MNNKDEIYINAPLEEVVCEIRFSGEPAIACNVDKFYEKIREKYNKVLVPIEQPQQSVPELYRFETPDGKNGVIIGINKIAVFTKNYPGFGIFKEEVTKIVNDFGKLFNLKKLNRVGLRYINIINFTREGAEIPLKSYINIGVKLPWSESERFKGLNMAFVLDSSSGGNITTQIGQLLSQDKNQEALLLDFDYSKENNLVFDKFQEYLIESHMHTKDLFIKLISEEYMKFIKGDVI